MYVDEGGIAPGDGRVESEFERYLEDPGHFPDPYPLFHRIRAVNPIYRATNGLWCITNYEATHAALKNVSLSRHEGAISEVLSLRNEDDDLETSKAIDSFQNFFLNLDDPDHLRIRRLASGPFVPKAVQKWKPLVEDVVRNILDEFEVGEDFDFVTRVAYPVPERVICTILGVPSSDHELWNRWSNAIIVQNRAERSANENRDAAREAFISFDGYARELIRERRHNLGDDLLSFLISAEEEGKGLAEDELVATLILLIIAGHETTANTLANVTRLLVENPDQLEMLRDDPALIPGSVEEAVRMETPATGGMRVALEDTEVVGNKIAAGDRVMTFITAANHDPDWFPDPERFDIMRRGTHLAFGSGMHYCLGAPLARLEGEVLVRNISQRVTFEMAGRETWRPNHLRLVETVPMRLAARRQLD